MVYNYTKPRGPVAASNRGPGPCYDLPPLTGRAGHDPRSVHARAPAFPFGIHHHRPTDDGSPGPVHFPDPKIYRDGPDGSPRYSLYARRRELTAFSVPGPGTYAPERAGPLTRHKPPAFSFGITYPPVAGDQTPGL